MSRFREPFNGFSHLLCAYFALGGLIVLVASSWEDAPRRVSLAVYGASLTLMLAASAAYHSLHGSGTRIRRLRKIDHAAIYVLIAGTYTPLTYNMFEGFWRLGLLALVWGLALFGIGVKVFHIARSGWVSVSLYIALGWLAVLGVPEILRVLPAGGVWWLFGGGVLYTLGAVLLAAKRPVLKSGGFGYHELWHLFVGAAAFCHFMLVWGYVV